MKTFSEIMSHQSKEEYLESCQERYQSRNRAGRTAIINEIAERYGMDGFHDSGDDCCIAATCLVHDFTLAKRPDISILSKDSGTVHWD